MRRAVMPGTPCSFAFCSLSSTSSLFAPPRSIASRPAYSGVRYNPIDPRIARQGTAVDLQPAVEHRGNFLRNFLAILLGSLAVFPGANLPEGL